MKTHFNFRDVTQTLGIPSSNENNWAIGHILVRLAARHGTQPERILTEKTDPCPTVNAPHCIAHYPMSLFDEACSEINKHWDDKTRQLTMEF
jgi:hypothetical protein